MQGTVIVIHIAAAYGSPVEPISEVEAVAGKGLRGDRYFGSRRQVTIVAAGELEAAAAELGVAGDLGRTAPGSKSARPCSRCGVIALRAK